MYKNNGLVAYERERSNILAFLILALDIQERSAPRSDRLPPEKGLGKEFVFGLSLSVVEHRKPMFLAGIQDPLSSPLTTTSYFLSFTVVLGDSLKQLPTSRHLLPYPIHLAGQDL